MIFYLQTRLTDFSNCRTQGDIELTHIGTLKTILSELLALVRDQRASRRDVRDALDLLRQQRDCPCPCAAPRRAAPGDPPPPPPPPRGGGATPSSPPPSRAQLARDSPIPPPPPPHHAA